MQNSVNVIVTTNAPMVQVEPALDAVKLAMGNGNVAPALDELFDDLLARRDEEPEIWRQYARACLEHPLRHLLHQDPFTYRAFSKPRGYAGDAVMMDYIYGLGEGAEAARACTPLGRAILQYMGTRPSALGVRYRRQVIARLIDRTASRGGSTVFALAAGHLREVEISHALRAGKIREFLAMDQDEASLAVVDRDYSPVGIRAVEGSVRQILTGKANPGQFDFVYAAGLYDYLNASTAAALTRRLFDMTRPGGTLLVPNFLAGVRDTGYMESFMDWFLVYRNHADMEALAASLPGGSVAEHEVFDDPYDAITYLVVTKKESAD